MNPTGSTLEKRFQRLWARLPMTAGLVPMELEWRFDPSRKWRFDVAFPAVRVAVELEGRPRRGMSRHTTWNGYVADCQKYNAAAILGWRVLRYTGDDLKKRPVQIVEEITGLVRILMECE